ncbi:DUF2779 domain-containing protein [Mycoplasma procyoni]|uniref:DUF2779 domain-containing protein n=1 Tax=Mycoplasma procyoni TaxID=568784 RepID=UPI00197B5AEA|nr:DUF2779 domain-containing protein [Mycoplasma procyoni]MBN3534570.1 DUF2779 domain-containing protein [Mycoplasma procyoni]
MDKKEYITFSQFKRFCNSQPYFIWNTIEKAQSDEIEDDEIADNYWEVFGYEDFSSIETKELPTHSSTSAFNKLNEIFEDQIRSTFGIEQIYFVKAKSNEEAIEETKKVIESKKYRIILYGAFEYKGAIAKIPFIDLQEEKISQIKVSSSTKKDDILKLYWSFWIAKQTLKIHKISLFLLEKVEFPKKDQQAFKEIFHINTGKTTKKWSPAKEKKLISEGADPNDFFYFKTRLAQEGLELSAAELDEDIENVHIDNNIFAIISSREIAEKELPEINYAIDSIMEAKEITTLDPISNLDNGDFAANPNFSEIVALKHPELAGFSGNILSKKTIIDMVNNPNIPLYQLLREVFLSQQIIKGEIKIHHSEELEKILNDLNDPKKRIVWYDFEGYSLPYPPIDGVGPYNQVVFQLSIKETHNNKIIDESFDSGNIVYDPKKIDENSFFEIIKRIYSNKADHFVVFNEGYELTRIKEMLNIIKAKTENTPYYSKYLEAQKYADHIKEKTIDLAKFFSGYSEKNKNLPFIFIPDLKGFYSIKKIEKYITKNNIKLDHLITPYVELEVQNGLIAMSKAISRAVGDIGDNEWEITKKNLKKYCENDVMAMIMVKDFINYIMKNYQYTTPKSKK